MMEVMNLYLIWTVLFSKSVFAQWNNGFYQPPIDPNVCNLDTCKLPKCFCAGIEVPLNMDMSAIPQIVMFTFDDAVNEQNAFYYPELFPKEMKNPNGCPVTATFFLSHNWTDYTAVNELYDRGHEIASHSITHRMPQTWWRFAGKADWKNEIIGQRDLIVENTNIPSQHVAGMRSPFLETGGDTQYEMLTETGLQYDASFMTGPHDNGGAWPFTLDTVSSWRYCTNHNCPKAQHPGIWQVPLNRWIGIDGNPCSMVDSCQQQPSHKGETLAYLWQNFNRHYYGNKAPVGVNMHATWFKMKHNFEGMKEFVKTLSEMNDVYILTVQQTLEWMKNPITIEDAKTFKPWQSSCNSVQAGTTSSIPRGNFNDPATRRHIPRNNRRPANFPRSREVQSNIENDYMFDTALEFNDLPRSLINNNEVYSSSSDGRPRQESQSVEIESYNATSRVQNMNEKLSDDEEKVEYYDDEEEEKDMQSDLSGHSGVQKENNIEKTNAAINDGTRRQRPTRLQNNQNRQRLSNKNSACSNIRSVTLMKALILIKCIFYNSI